MGTEHVRHPRVVSGVATVPNRAWRATQNGAQAMQRVTDREMNTAKKVTDLMDDFLVTCEEGR